MSRGEPSPGADVSRGEPSPGADVSRGEPSPGADVARASPVPAQMWEERAQSRCRCGRGEPSPGADVGGASQYTLCRCTQAGGPCPTRPAAAAAPPLTCKEGRRRKAPVYARAADPGRVFKVVNTALVAVTIYRVGNRADSLVCRRRRDAPQRSAGGPAAVRQRTSPALCALSISVCSVPSPVALTSPPPAPLPPKTRITRRAVQHTRAVADGAARTRASPTSAAEPHSLAAPPPAARARRSWSHRPRAAA